MSGNYFMPTRILSGKGCLTQEAARLSEMGSHALLVTGTRSARASGALQDATAALAAQGISWTLFDAVEANPSIETVRLAADAGRQAGADFVIGIGGGSPMDAAKAVAVLLVTDLAEEDLFSGSYPDNTAPIVLIPTTAGTGSEVTPYAILTDHRNHMKRNMGGPQLFPKLAFLDASYMTSLPWSVTLNTAVDALSHAVEGWLAVRGTLLSEPFARTGMREMMDVLRELHRLRQEGFEARDIPFPLREKALHGSMFGGITIAQTGTTLLHAMGYCLTIWHDLDHGLANGLLMPAYFRALAEKIPARMQTLLDHLGFPDMDACDTFLTGQEGVLTDQSETAVPLTEKEVLAFADISFSARNAANTPVVFSKEELAAQFRTIRIPVRNSNSTGIR